MAWEDILPAVAGRRGSTERPHQVTMAWRITSGRKGPSCIVTLGGEVVQGLGWKAGARARVQIDRAAGRLRIAVATDAGTWSLLGKKNEKLLHITFPLQLTAEKQPAARVEHSVADGALLLTLPEWARAVSKESLQTVTPLLPPVEPVAAKASPKPPKLSVPAGIAAEDEREAELMVIAGKGARAISEEFGWPLEKAQAFAIKVRGRKAA